MSLEFRFRIRRGRFTLDVEMNVPGKGVTAVFGPSGCGKTTLLRAVAGLEEDPGGLCMVNGECVIKGGKKLKNAVHPGEGENPFNRCRQPGKNQLPIRGEVFHGCDNCAQSTAVNELHLRKVEDHHRA